MATWRELITEEMEWHDETLDDVVAAAPELATGWLDDEFHNGYGSSEGCAFTVWTTHYVYFPGVYDGKEWVASVSRHPDGKPTKHVGGE